MREPLRQIYRFDGFQVDEPNRQLLRDGQPVPLPKKAFDLLLVLLENNGQALTKNELLDKVWPDQFVEEVNLTVQIAALRKALCEHKDNARYILTIPKHGYRFVANFQREEETKLVVEHHTATRVVVEKKAADNGFSDAVEAAQSSGYGVPGLATNDSIKAAITNAQIYSGQSSDKRINRRLAMLAVGGLALVLVALGIGVWRYNERQAAKLIPFEQATIEQVTTNSRASLAALSPDGKLFVYTSLNRGLENLMLGHVEGGEPVELRPAADVTYKSLKFSPDGAHIYYVVTGGEYSTGALMKIHVFGGIPEKLRENISARVAFSPDMKKITYAPHDQKKVSSLFIANTDATGERELVSRPENLPFRSFSPSWSPDGKTIAVGAVANEDTETYEVFVVSAVDGSTRPLTAQAWNEVLATGWLPDGSGLIVVAKEKDFLEKTQLWSVSYPEGVASRIFSDLDGYNAATVSLSSDGRSLLAIQFQKMGSVWVAPADNLNQAKQITFSSVGRLDGALNLDWTPDGRLLYGVSFRDSLNIWTMDADGNNQKQLTSAGYSDAYLSATADGRYMVFQSNRSGDWEIWRANSDGSDMKQLTGGGKNRKPTLAPDSRWVFYTSVRDKLETIWRISIDGGEPVRLTDRLCDWPRVSPDAKWIACGDTADGKAKIAIVSIEGGEPVKLFDVPRLANFTYGIRWMPDGKAVTYRDWANGIWRQPIEVGEPKRLEGLPEEKIGGHGWSRDGKQFAFTRGTEMPDVVLIRSK